MRVILLTLFGFLATSPSANSQAMIDSLTSSKLNQMILHDHINPMDTSYINPSVYKLKVLDTLSLDRFRIALVAFPFDDRGFGNRTTRTLICCYDVSTLEPKEIGCYSLGSVGNGRLLKFGDGVLAELTTGYGAGGWGVTTYHLTFVWPEFQPEFFVATLEECAMMNDMPCQRSFIKLVPDSSGSLSQMMVWQTSTRSDMNDNLLSRRDSVSCTWLSRESTIVKLTQMVGLSQDSLRTLFRASDEPIRYLGKLADSLLKGM